MTLRFFDNMHIASQVSNVEKGDTIVLHNQLSRKRWTRYLQFNNINEEKLELKYITKEEFYNMEGTKDKKKFPFKRGVCNPPYSDGDNLLYPPAFKKLLELCEEFNITMPVDLESQQVRVKNHNPLVKKHMIQMSENVTDQFGVGIPDIRHIKASALVENEVPDYVDPLDSYKPIYPERKRLQPRRGQGGFNRKTNQSEDGIMVMTTIYRGNKIQWAKVEDDIAKRNKLSMISDAPYFVLVGENPSKGLFNTAIVENNGTKWGSGIFALDANSKEEAKKLEQWLVSKEIQQEVAKLLELKNVYSCSGPMMEKLPWYE